MSSMYVAPPELKQQEPPPEASQLGAVVWVRKNLFNSVFNSILTVVLGVLGFLAVRALLDWAFDEDRLWAVIPPNSTNYAVGGFPREELGRVWTSFWIFAALVGVSVGVWRPAGRSSVARIVAGVRSFGVALLALGLLAPSTFGARWVVAGVGVVLVVAVALGSRALGPGALEPRIPASRMLLGALVLVLAVVWVLPIDSSTQVPLTVAGVVALVAAVLGRVVVENVGDTRVKPVVLGAWVVLVPANWLHVQRKPVFDWDTVVGAWLPWIAGVVVVGVVAIGFVSRANREVGGLVNSALVIAAIASWLVEMPMVARALLLVTAGVALATPTFGSDERGRRRMIGAFVGLSVFVSYLFALGAAETGLDTRNAYFGGFNLTVMLAIGAIALSVPLGLALALGRTSSMPLFRLMSTGYIETVRGVPLITLLFFFRFGVLNFVPVGQQIDAIVLILVAMTMFSAAYLAENVRGGLQSIPKGQYEAAKALGMSTAQMTMLITLPQALRAVIPALVGQVIALFKDTSLVAIVGLADFFRIARDVVPGQATSLGSIFENLLFAAAVYWVFTFSFSRASQRLERRLGVGTR